MAGHDSDKRTTVDIETLNALGLRLFTPTASPTSSPQDGTDMRLTDQVCDKLAGLGFRVAEIAETAMTQASAAARRDPLGALAETRRGELGARLR
jgi:hypothetical protein